MIAVLLVLVAVKKCFAVQVLSPLAYEVASLSKQRSRTSSVCCNKRRDCAEQC
jgi:hypothetical protein